MLKILYYISIILPLCIWAETTNDSYPYIVYSQEEMHNHKKLCTQKMLSNPSYLKDPSYQMERALLSIEGEDCDSIPKIAGAGEIFYDKTTPYQLMHNGVKITLNSYYDAQWITDVIYGLKGHHEPQEEKCFYEVLKYIPEAATMIELGSYWAYYSLWFSSKIKDAKNYLIEPSYRRLQTGIKNFELNNKTGIFQQGFAGIMTEAEPDITNAKFISIDDFIEREKILHVNILHADIQGAEYAMLQTTIKHLDKIDFFFISTHGQDNAHLPCLMFLKAHGFTILAEHTTAQSYGGDGLIVAKRKSVKGPEQITIQKH